MFEKEFEDLPPAVRVALQAEIEFVVRKAVSAKRTYISDPSKGYLTDIEMLDIIYAIFDLASRLKHPRGN
jgi:hypothetical protein